jgi:cytochrome c oxidase subunit II
VIAIGHQYWWEFRYPKLGIVTANELHIPVSDPSHPTPTFLQLLSADTDHSFWVPELAGKPTSFQTTPTECGWTRSAQASFLASVPSIAEYSTRRCCSAFRWMGGGFCRLGARPAETRSRRRWCNRGRRVFERNACMNCHRWTERQRTDTLALT